MKKLLTILLIYSLVFVSVLFAGPPATPPQDSSGTPEGTAILSTGETIGKVLTAGGDNSSSWEAAGAGDLLANGTIPLTANWDVGAFTLTGTQFISDIAIGTAPFVVTSTTEVVNLFAATATYALTGDNATAFFNSGTIEHERGGLETGVNAYSGIVAITGGATYELNTLEELEIASSGGAYMSDILASTNEANFKSIVNLEAGTDFLAPAGDGSSLTGLVLSQFDTQTAWRVFYSNTNGDVTEIALGADGTYLKSNGAAAPPTFATPSGSGDVSKVGTPVNNQIGVWTGDGTIEGDSDLTFDGTDFVTTGDIACVDVNASGIISATGGITSGASATPTMTFEDSDLLGADEEAAKIFANGTTLTDGSEVTDLTFTYMDAGTVTNAIIIDGSDNQVEFQINTTHQANDIIMSEIADLYAYQEIPIAWMNGGTSEPDALDDSTRTPYAYRTFAHDADEDLNFVWIVPADLSGTTIQYRVYYLVTNATGPSSEGVVFGLSGVSLGDNDATNGAKGTVVVVTDPTITAIQHDVLITGWSGDVTITNLVAGEVSEVALIRDVSDAADDYAQVVGVFMIQIRYVMNPAR